MKIILFLIIGDTTLKSSKNLIFSGIWKFITIWPLAEPLLFSITGVFSLGERATVKYQRSHSWYRFCPTTPLPRMNRFWWKNVQWIFTSCSLEIKKCHKMCSFWNMKDNLFKELSYCETPDYSIADFKIIP